jgi:hypothetical protein
MRRLSVKQLLVMLFAGLLTMSGTVFGDDAMQNGDTNRNENPETGEQNRDKSCDDELFGLLSCCEGDQNQHRKGEGPPK